MHHHILWLPKPLIVRWCNGTNPNPGEFILMTIWAVSDRLCLLVWSLSKDDGEDTALRNRPKVTEGFCGWLSQFMLSCHTEDMGHDCITCNAASILYDFFQNDAQFSYMKAWVGRCFHLLKTYSLTFGLLLNPWHEFLEVGLFFYIWSCWRPKETTVHGTVCAVNIYL